MSATINESAAAGRPLASVVPAAGDMVVTIETGSGGLDRFLGLVADRRRPLIKCLSGSLTLVSPSPEHERGDWRLRNIVEAIGDVLDIDYRAAGSSLLRPPGRADDGIEPDSCYYIEHEADSRDPGTRFDLAVVPPPELLVEVVVTHSPERSLAICLGLGIPEAWLYWPLKGHLEFHHLEAGRYVARDRSRSFPFLGPDDLLPWLQAPEDEPDNRWKRRLRAWVRDELGPRRA